METDSPTTRNRGKKLDSSKLSALEKLKKARLGEKVEDDPEPDDEDMYEYIEEEYDEEEEFKSKKKNNKNNHDNDEKSKKASSAKRNFTKDKVSTHNETEPEKPSGTDIRTAFFRASAKPSKASAESAKIEDDEFANSIMEELKRNSTKSSSTSSNRHKQMTAAPIASNRSLSHVPFAKATNSPSMSVSPAGHKRKLSPTSSNYIVVTKSGSEIHKSKKIELDDELVQQLFDSDSQPAANANEITWMESSGKLKQNDSVINCVKREPVEPTLMNNDGSLISIKKESRVDDDNEALENIELLSQLTLEASNSSTLAKQLNLPFKQDISLNETTMNSSIIMDDADFQLHLKNQGNSDKFLFYWLDSFEDQFNSNGTVYMFGKMPIVKQQREEDAPPASTNTDQTQQPSSPSLSFVSVCCVIKNIPKRVYILPRKYKRNRVKPEPGCPQIQEPVTMEMVSQELNLIMSKLKISSYTSKVVKKNFAFDKKFANKEDYEDIPYESEYLQVEYHPDAHASNRVLPADLSGETFICIFGAQSSYTEHLLVDLKLKGPCWLLMSNAKRRENSGSMLSWCKCEYNIDNYRSISLYHEGVTLETPSIPLPQTPPLTVLTIILRTVLNQKSKEHEIVCACGMISHKFYLEKATMPTTMKSVLHDSYFCALTKPSHGSFPHDLQAMIKNIQGKFRVEMCGSERALLAFLLCKIHSLDVDVIVGHDLFGFNFDILLNRCVVNKVPHWSRLGRLKRSTMPSLPGGGAHKKPIAGQNTALNNLIMQQRIQTVCSGRLLCDVMISAKELLTKCKSFDLPELVQHILFKKEAQTGISRDYEEEKNVGHYYNSSQLIMKFLQLGMTDCNYIMRICNDLQCLQLAYQITCIAGNVLSRTLIGGRSERNEFLLLHAFYDKDFILPEKATGGGYKAKQQAIAAAAQSTANAKNAANAKAVNATKSEATISNESQMVNTEENDDELLSKMIIDEDEDSQSRKKKQEHGKESVNTHTSSNGYTGGLVLEPRVGFYDKFILLLDFNSLYPSIIQEYNICFTTISRPQNELAEKDIDEYIETCIKIPSPDEKPGILPLEIRKLVDSRRQVKQLMQDKNLSPDLRLQYDIRQKALKLTANSVYGCLGFENSRFYCKPLAALITKNGRNLLMKTKELVESKKIEVIYGDTDSIMINTNLNDYDQVLKLGNMLKAEVNKLYKHLEIDIDGVYKCLLLLRKKKYAALTIVGRNPKDSSLICQQELKGLDVVRRDWCLLAKQIGERVIGEILSGQSCDVVLTNINKILNETGEKIKNNSFDLNLFEISKQLNRNPEDYNDANHQSHVIVALRHNSDTNNSKKYKSGDVVSYIICEDGTTNSSTQRAYSKGDLLKPEPNSLKLDTKYYLAQQIHPVVTRLCEPIEGIDAFHVAQCLGLDPTGFVHKKSGSHHANSGSTVNIAPTQLSKQQKKIETYMNELEKFNNCVTFKYVCPNCKTEQSWQSLFTKLNGSAVASNGGSSNGASSSTTTTLVKAEPKLVDEKIEYDDDDLTLDETSIVKAGTLSKSTNFRCILDSCSNPVCKLKPLNKLAYVKNLITLQLHKFIKQYYQNWLVCEDQMCSCRTKRISCKFIQNKPQCIECERSAANLEYTHSDLYYQIKFFKFIFDIEAYKNYYKDDALEISNMLRSNKELQIALNQLRDHVNRKLRMDVYGIVDMSQLFQHI